MSNAILMPALSPTMEEGTLAKWHVKPGDHVSPGDVIAEIETDKATMEVEAVDEGVIAKLLVPEGTENVKVKTPIAQMAGDGGEEEAAAPSAQKPFPPAPEGRATPAPAKAPVVESAAVTPSPAPQGGGERVAASPLARRMAQQAGIDLHALHGSGPHGRVVKRDIETAAAAPQASAPKGGELAPLQAKPNLPYKEGEYALVPLDGMRKVIARRMTQSFQEVPHFSLTIDMELDRLVEARKQLNARLERDNVKLSINDILIRACALALKKSPEANVSFIDNGLLKHKHAHIAVAVAIPGGLVTPVIFHADSKGLAEISKEMVSLAEKARARKLLPQDYEGGTFTISNLGMYGIKSFTSIINEPQSMILSVGAGEPRPIVKNGAVAIATMISLTLTCDHRAVDGAIGAEFLGALRGYVEDPMTMML